MAPFNLFLSFLRALLLLSPCPVYLTPLYLHSLTELQAGFAVPTCTLFKVLCTRLASLLAKLLLPYFVKCSSSLRSSSSKKDPWPWKPKHCLQQWLQSQLLILNIPPLLSRPSPSPAGSRGSLPGLSYPLPLFSKLCSHSWSGICPSRSSYSCYSPIQKRDTKWFQKLCFLVILLFHSVCSVTLWKRPNRLYQ